MEKRLEGKRVAILMTHGFEQSEFEMPYKSLKEEGALVDIVSLKKEKIKGWKDKNWSDSVDADLSVDDANCENYDALVLPGGVMNPDFLRSSDTAISFVGCFMESGKPVAAICHGPWLLIETGKIKGRKVTSYKSIKTDLENAGAIWIDTEVVVDRGLVTSRSPKDLPVFCQKMIEEVMEGIHSYQKTAKN
jgi:protease I